MEAVICESCSSQPATLCCLICKEPPRPFCACCYSRHEADSYKEASYEENRGKHYPVPVCTYAWSRRERDKLRNRVLPLALNSVRLKEDIPDIETMVREVNTAYEQLTKLLESWRDSRIAALQKCHALVVKQVETFLEQTAQHILDPVASTTIGPLESYLQTAGGELTLLQAQIKRSEAALAKACVLNVESDLAAVREVFLQEESALEVQKSEECASSEKVVLAKSKESQTHNEQLEESLKAAKTLLEEYQMEIGKLQKQISDSLKLAQEREAECTELESSYVRACKDRENFAQKIGSLRVELTQVGNEKIYLSTKAANYVKQISDLTKQIKACEKQLSEKDTKIEDLQLQLGMATTLHFGKKGKQFHMKPQAPIAEEVSLEDSGNLSELTSSFPKTEGKRDLPPVRTSLRKWQCPDCTVKNSYVNFLCKNCSSPRPKWTCVKCKLENDAKAGTCACGHIRDGLIRGIVGSLSPRNSELRYQVYEENEEVEQRIQYRPFTACQSPRIKIPTSGVHKSPKLSQKPEEELKSPEKEAES